MWMALMTPPYSERLPEVGVFVEDDPPAVPPIEQVGPLVGKNGLPIRALVLDRTADMWLFEAGQSQPGEPLPTCLPPTYQVRLYFYRFTPRECLKTTISFLGVF